MMLVSKFAYLYLTLKPLFRFVKGFVKKNYIFQQDSQDKQLSNNIRDIAGDACDRNISSPRPSIQ
jgi:hypothetical protein